MRAGGLLRLTQLGTLKSRAASTEERENMARSHHWNPPASVRDLVLIDGRHAPFSLAFEKSWPRFDANGRTVSAATHILHQIADAGVLGKRWVVLGTPGRLIRCVPEVGRTPWRQWLTPREYGDTWHGEVCFYGDFAPILDELREAWEVPPHGTLMRDSSEALANTLRLFWRAQQLAAKEAA